MSVPAAYLGVILIWTTTPLAIKWSSEGPGFLFGVTARMTLSAVLCVALVKLLRASFPWHRGARRTYVASGMGIYGAMLAVYWSAQFIPSGWVAVLFGLTPIATAVMAAAWLNENAFTPPRILGTLLAVTGLFLIFGSGQTLGPQAPLGIAGLLAAVIVHSLSMVWVKRIGARVPALATTTGGLAVASPLFLITWWLVEGGWPENLPDRAAAAILYLAVFGSVIGFMWFYYILKHVEAGKVALITVITPVTALLTGKWLNAEAIAPAVWGGTGLILLGLLVHQWAVPLLRALQRGRRADAAAVASNGQGPA